MEIIIVRQEHKPWGIDGHLYINRQRVCDTVEHPTRHLPAGEYSVVNDKCQMSNIQCPISMPFRHGDGALSSIHGEIIVGKLALPGLVTQSAETYQRLYERLKKAFQRNTLVRLTIRG